MTIERTSRRTTKITTDVGLTVSYNGVYNVYVNVYGRHWNKTAGLCGTFNGDENDDLLIRNNTYTRSVLEFGNSWKTQESCPDAPPSILPCDRYPENSDLAKQNCSLLKTYPFNQCNVSVDPNNGHIENCEFDVCGCTNNPVACLCEAYAAYAEECSRYGIPIQWSSLSEFQQCGMSE